MHIYAYGKINLVLMSKISPHLEIFYKKNTGTHEFLCLEIPEPVRTMYNYFQNFF